MTQTAIKPDELVEALASLTPEERARVLAAVRSRAAQRETRTHISWANLHALKGLVRLGGDAVEDCRRLYDE
jgi:hypothetical protein